MDQVLVEIVDKDLNPVPTGSVGTIRVRTPGIAQEVELEGVEKRNSDLVVDGWIYTGDVGVLDEDGFLSIVGRTSDLINRGGVNVYPSEIEEVLLAHPNIQEAAVIGVPDAILGEEIAAFVTSNEPIDTQRLSVFCAGRLHTDKQPRSFHQVDSMPTNANGKLVRRELFKLAVEGPQ